MAGLLGLRQVGGRSQLGVTLIEVLIVVVIVAILSSVALPAYQESLRKGRRADAKAGLFHVASRQEQLMLDRGTYATDMKRLGYPASASMTTEEGFYTISTAACSGGTIGNCFMLTATPAGLPQSKDSKCTTFMLDSKGAKTATGSTASECW